VTPPEQQQSKPTAPTQPPKVGLLQEVFNLDEGPVTLIVPATLSEESYADLADQLELFLRRAKRRAFKSNDEAANRGGLTPYRCSVRAIGANAPAQAAIPHRTALIRDGKVSAIAVTGALVDKFFRTLGRIGLLCRGDGHRGAQKNPASAIRANVVVSRIQSSHPRGSHNTTQN
jgi:hypothetical protein